VGKGAFGKVMLVRKKQGVDEGKVFAMKVLKKVHHYPSINMYLTPYCKGVFNTIL
jgi:hypothetical protein